jgi:hypothetical protein
VDIRQTLAPGFGENAKSRVSNDSKDGHGEENHAKDVR